MFTAEMPLAFATNATLDVSNQGNPVVVFCSSTLLLRYRNIPREVGREPRFLTATCQEDGQGMPQNGPWRIRSIATPGPERLFALTFDGDAFLQLLNQSSAYAYSLLSSFLDQDVIELALNLGPILEQVPPGAPAPQPRADRQLTVPLHLRLSMRFELTE